MKTVTQVNELIIRFDIRTEMENSFQKILATNSAEELDVENRNISINSKNIAYSITESNFHRFQTPILDDDQVAIGYFALVVTNENEQIDECFVINR